MNAYCLHFVLITAAPEAVDQREVETEVKISYTSACEWSFTVASRRQRFVGKAAASFSGGMTMRQEKQGYTGAELALRPPMVQSLGVGTSR
jgi:hypothetical protein